MSIVSVLYRSLKVRQDCVKCQETDILKLWILKSSKFFISYLSGTDNFLLKFSTGQDESSDRTHQIRTRAQDLLTNLRSLEIS